MKHTSSIFMLMMLTFFALSKQRKSLAYVNVKVQSEKYSDSLLNSGVDTLIYYFKGCASCMCGISEISLIYYSNNGIYELVEFYTPLSNSKKDYIKHFSPMCYTGLRKGYSVYFAEQYLYNMKNEPFQDDSNYIKRTYNLNHAFESVKIKTGNDSFNYIIDDYNKDLNITKFRTIFINKFLLDISDVTLLDKQIRVHKK